MEQSADLEEAASSCSCLVMSMCISLLPSWGQPLEGPYSTSKPDRHKPCTSCKGLWATLNVTGLVRKSCRLGTGTFARQVAALTCCTILCTGVA